jgi:hypothetical protein
MGVSFGVFGGDGFLIEINNFFNEVEKNLDKLVDGVLEIG